MQAVSVGSTGSSESMSGTEPTLAMPARETRRRWAKLWFTSKEEARYQAFKYQGLHLVHLGDAVCIMACTIIFCALWGSDVFLTETIFPKTFLLRALLYAATACFEAAACLVFLYVRGSKRYAATYHLFFGLWMVAVLSFDPHRVVILWDDSTTYVEELAHWWRIYQPDYDTSDCGGIILREAGAVPDEGPQHCYFNSYEAVYMIMIMGCMTVQGFYFRMPPSGFLLMARPATQHLARRADSSSAAVRPRPNTCPAFVSADPPRRRHPRRSARQVRLRQHAPLGGGHGHGGHATARSTWPLTGTIAGHHGLVRLHPKA